MAKEDIEDEELDEDLEEQEETETQVTVSNSTMDYKRIVITEMTRIVKGYREKMFQSNDMALIDAMNKKTDIMQVINHVMNNLVSKRILGGADEITYEYIHEYYVDNFDIVGDKWSKYIGTPSFQASNRVDVRTEAKEEERAKITPEMREKMYQEAYREIEAAAKLKAEAKFKENEAKRKEKEKAALEKKKELEAQKLAEQEERIKASGQMSLFD